jgi:protein-tyrosine phosphatase
MKHQILFICTGNYYRSRFAEIYFNHLAESQAIAARAFSRGLEVFRHSNVGAISLNTLYYLDQLEISLKATPEFPVQISEDDLLTATHIIALDEAEHRPMVQQYFPDWTDKITYWAFEDVQFLSPKLMMPELEKKIKSFIADFA